MIPTTPPPSFNAEQAIETLKKLSSFDPKVLLMPHFGISMDYKYVFEETKRKINSYIEEVRKMKNENLSYDEMLSQLIKKVANEANMKEEEMHPYVIHSLRVTLSGIITYLYKKNKKLNLLFNSSYQYYKCYYNCYRNYRCNDIICDVYGCLLNCSLLCCSNFSIA